MVIELVCIILCDVNVGLLDNLCVYVVIDDVMSWLCGVVVFLVGFDVVIVDFCDFDIFVLGWLYFIEFYVFVVCVFVFGGFMVV